MKARWILAIALAVGLAAWFTLKSRELATAGEHAGDSRSVSAAPSMDAPRAPTAPAAVSAPNARIAVAPSLPLDSGTEVEDPVQAGTRLYGLVLPLAGSDRLDRPVTVGLTDRFSEKRFVEVGPDGAYSFSIETTGPYWIVAESIDSGVARRAIEFDINAGEQRLDLQLELPLELQVEVVDRGGEPIRGVDLIAVATSEVPGGWLDVQDRRSNTNYGLGMWREDIRAGTKDADPVYGSLRLQMPPPIYISLFHLQHVLATQRVESGQTSVRFVLDSQRLLQPGRLHLRLIDAKTRQPLSLGLQLFGNGSQLTPRTELDGTYTGEFAPGWLGVMLLDGKYEGLELDVRIDPGELTDLGDISLDAPTSLSGVVVDESGRGVAARFFLDEIESTPGSPTRSWLLNPVTSSNDGTFGLAGLSHRHYLLRLDDREETYAIRAVDVDLSGGSIEGLRIELVPGIPLAIRGSAERWPVERYSVIDEHGMRLRSGRFEGPEPQEILLAPGQYEIEVRMGESGERIRRQVTIANDPVEMSLP